MKYLTFAFLVVLAVACGKEDTMEMGENEEESSLTCAEDPFLFTIEANGITMTSEKCWMVFADNPTGQISETGLPAVIKWEYPGYPMWDGANSFGFNYYDASIQSDTDYDATVIKGVLEFDGSDGEMFQGLGDGAVTFSMDEYNEEEGYACGSFSGTAMWTDMTIVELTGSFKAELNP